MEQINDYNDFIAALLRCGFTLFGGNNEGFFSLLDYSGPGIRWHIDDADHDPWQWALRVLRERDDIAYGKYFFHKSGYITREWFPYFLRARRDGYTFPEAYDDGYMSRAARRIWDVLNETPIPLPVYMLKREAGFTSEERPAFERALVELQMRMFIGRCGTTRKVNAKGEPYGWNAAVYCLTEQLFGQEAIDEADALTLEEATETIRARVMELNPQAQERAMKKFIASGF